jgi:hypothetical protein
MFFSSKEAKTAKVEGGEAEEEGVFAASAATCAFLVSSATRHHIRGDTLQLFWFNAGASASNRR